MRDRELYAQLLGLKTPWFVSAVEVSASTVEILIESRRVRHRCPECGTACPGYDVRERRWRHLDTMQYRTVLIAEVPRISCKKHGVRQVAVPWAEPGSRLTALFEALVIDWLQEANIRAVSRLLGLSWDQVDGVLQRAVCRGLQRRQRRAPRRLGVDETSFQRRFEYVTVVADMERGVVEYVADGRSQEALQAYYRSLGESEKATIESVTMDMWGPYIYATEQELDNAGAKIAFDKYHVAWHLSRAVDRVRASEHRELRKEGDQTLAGTKHLWLFHPDRLEGQRAIRFEELVQKHLKTSRAWMLKQLAMEMWNIGEAERARVIFQRWDAWAIRSQLEPMRRVARMMKKYLQGILTTIHLGVTNARLEGMNATIQWLKRSARGFRNRERFRNAIYFRLGGLDLYPAALTHTDP